MMQNIRVGRCLIYIMEHDLSHPDARRPLDMVQSNAIKFLWTPAK